MQSIIDYFAPHRRLRIIVLVILLLCTLSFGFGNGLLDIKWCFIGLLSGITIVGVAVAARQAWVLQPILRRVEFLWASGAPMAEVLVVSAPLANAVGEIGYKGKLIRSWALFAGGQRKRATEEAASAHLARKPFWVRWSVHVCLHQKRRWQWPEKALVKIAPDLPNVCWLRLGKAIDERDKEKDAGGWKLLMECVNNAQEDALLLEACMVRALDRLAYNQSGGGTPISGPEARALLECAMTLLLRRHNDPRLPWERIKLADYLLKERRHEAVLALCTGLPPAYRPIDLWLIEARTWGQLGDLACAYKTIDAAVKVHPTSYPLWMEAYRIAMANRDGTSARRALEQASKYVNKQTSAPVRWEYDLARSEYFFWVEGKPDAAWTHLSEVPEMYVENNRPRFTAQMLLFKKSYVEAYNKITELLKSQPDDTELQLMQSEAMAGMDAWEALLPHLDTMGDDARDRAYYWYLRGLANKNMASHRQAKEDLERAAWMESSNLRFVLSAGYACIEINDYERSEQHWRRALKIEPHNKEALLHLAESRELRHDTVAAKFLLRECLIHHPDFQEAQEMLLKLESN